MRPSICQPLSRITGRKGSGPVDRNTPFALATLLGRHTDGDQEELHYLLAHINSLMSSIKFTMAQDQNSITFLDLEIYKGRCFQHQGVLDIKPFTKATNLQTFLHFDSCHPCPIFTTIVKGELIRALRSSSDVDIFTQAVSKLLKRFQERGYPKTLLMKIASAVTYGDRPHFLVSQPKRLLEEGTAIFSARYHPVLATHDIRDALLDEDTPFRPMVARPRPTSTQDLLVRANTPGRSKFRVEKKAEASQPSTLSTSAAAASSSSADTPPLLPPLGRT